MRIFEINMKKITCRLLASASITAFTLMTVAPNTLADTQTPPDQNLTSMTTVTTSVTGQPDSAFANLENAYQFPLTSGTDWTGFCRQGSREITIQLPQYVDVTKIQITMEQNVNRGIYYPSHVAFEAESYGQWYSLGSVPSSVSPTNNQSNVTTQTYTLNSTGFTANAIRLKFPVAVWVFAKGLSVYGSASEQGEGLNTLGYKLIDSSQNAPVASQPTSSQNTGPLTPSSPNDYGIHNMLLVQTGMYKNLGTWSVANFEPMIGYVNDYGYMDAPLFDTILFLPYNNQTDTMSYWTKYMNDLFSTNTQLGALNQSVAATNQTLGRPGYKEKVVLSIPYFPYGKNAFGTMNGQTINFGASATDPSAINAREAALNWYVNELITRWQKADYQNLQLAGLYWDEESYKTTSPGEQELLDAGENIAKQNNLPLFWIPFYGADGVNKWSDFGFNAAWLQSNYIENSASAGVARIMNAMDEANQYGMGIEVELNDLNSSTAPLYQTFLQTLESNGFGGNQVSHAYYDGSKLLLQSEQSTNPSIRNFYDETAWFIMVGTGN